MNSRVNLERCRCVAALDDLQEIPRQKSSDRSRLLVLINMAKLVGEETHGLVTVTDKH